MPIGKEEYEYKEQNRPGIHTIIMEFSDLHSQILRPHLDDGTPWGMWWCEVVPRDDDVISLESFSLSPVGIISATLEVEGYIHEWHGPTYLDNWTRLHVSIVDQAYVTPLKGNDYDITDEEHADLIAEYIGRGIIVIEDPARKQ